MFCSISGLWFPMQYGSKTMVPHTLPKISYWNNLIFFSYWLLSIRIKNASFLTVLSVALYSYPPSFSLHPNFSFHRTSAVSCTDCFTVANERLELGFLTL